ncbi:hypothetical protein GP486_002854 [Trichoglossum hirsutum]|uniref:THO complex subunit 2 n=1 Tax=Trichoglossum hirsutum TaxID=265104 RepID=A0A9P8LE87_9PEZI|nr:hypothetical protein GP486_002854 [Trichoglossum hirsutum]
MAGPGGKRKRGDRTYSQDSSNGGSRPSTYSPENPNMGRQLREQDYRNNRQYGEQRGGGRGRRQSHRGGGHDSGRGGVAGRNDDRSRRSPSAGVNTIQASTKTSPTMPGAMFPPPVMQPKYQENTRRPTTPLEATSQQASAQQTSPTLTKQSSYLAEIEHQARPPFYNWEYLTDDRISSWKLSGRQEVAGIGTGARLDEDPMALSVIFQEILKSGLDKRIDPVDAGAVIKDILGPQRGAADERQAFDAPTLFLDTLSIFTDSDVSHPLLPIIIKSSEVSPTLMRLVLESPLLLALGLIRHNFDKVFVRTQTNLLYRQSKYNLLREESEGYSKLITELFTTSNEPPSGEIVRESFERVKALVGAFDLDVGRVLDVTLDVFAAVLVKQFRFFVKLLRASSWWPQANHFESVELFGQTFETLPKWALPGSGGWSTTEEDREILEVMKERRDVQFWERVREIGLGAYFEIGGRRMSAEQRAVFDNGDLENATDVDDRNWIDATGTLPPRGNRVAAQLLGFKLRFYASSARDPTDVLPFNLIYLAALLIKIGFISLRDLYPHLWPEDKDMERVREEKLREKAAKEKASRDATGAMNALAMAGALPDDSPPTSGRLRETDGNRGAPAGKTDPTTDKAVATAKVEEEKERLPEPKDQKVELLKSLLCIGAIPEALFILGRFPWIPDVYPEIIDYLHRILHHSLDKVYVPLRPMGGATNIREPKKIIDLAAMGKGDTRLIDAPPRKTLRWAQMDKDDTNENIDYRFYWDDWADNVPVCQTVDDVFSLCSTLLNISGVKIGRDPTLIFKLARIGKHSLARDRSEPNVERWINLSKRLLVPSLSLSKENPGVVSELFDLLKTFPTSTRFSIYAEWYYGATSRLPDIKSAFDMARLETSHVLKRISKTNARSMAKALAKVAYAAPGIVFMVALGQIESYDNLVEVVVECGRYFTQLGYDVLTWSLLSSLGGKGRNRVQADGILTSKWLSALSLFAGKIFKRYAVMNPTPILQYVASQLEKGSAVDLIVLREITNSMAGIVMSDTNITESQIQSLSGGEVLRQQTLLQLYDRRQESRTHARRLMRALTEPKLIAKLLILIAQERQTCLFKIADQDAHLKLLGNYFDEIHRVLAQYLDLLRSNLYIKDFDSIVPDVTSLMLDFGIEPGIAFWISRPSIVHEMKESDKGKAKAMAEQKQLQKGLEKAKAIDATKGSDTEMIVQPQDDDNAVPKAPDDTEKHKVDPEGDTEMKDPTITPDEPSPSAVATVANEVQEPWHPVLKSLMTKIRPALPEKTWSILSPPFYLTFWQLSLYDVSVPTKSYDEETTRLKNRLMLLRDDRSDLSQAGIAKKEKSQKLVLETQDRLHVEMREHIRSFSETKNRLRKEKDHWFAGLWGRWDALADAIIQYCIFPRAVLSPNDAVYCFKFIKQLHIQGTLNFRTMGVIDHIFRDNRLANTIFVCTAREAENLGRFLNELLRELGSWHADKTLYEKEAFGQKRDLPGFAKKLVSETQVGEFLEYEDFRRILYKWHKNINNALKTCLTGGEYMHIQNAITILKSIHQVFPVVNWNGRDMLTSVTELSKKEKREDIKLAATAVLVMLKKRETRWVFPQAFNLIDAAQGAGRAGSARPITPQPDSAAGKTLNPEASDFKPKPQNLGGSTASHLSGKMDVEDGEIEDVKTKDTSAPLQPPTVGASSGPLSSKDSPRPQSPSRSTRAQSDPNTSDLQAPTTSELAPPRTESRPATPTPRKDEQRSITAVPPLHHSIPPRPELGRSTLAAPTNIARTQHSLPTRPDVQPPRGPERRILDRPGERPGERRNGRDHRFPDHGRPDRLGDVSRDHSQDRRAPSPNRRVPSERGLERPPERSAAGDRDRREEGWGGENQRTSRNGPDDRFSRPTHDDRPVSRNGDWVDRAPLVSRERHNNEQQNGRRTPEIQGRSSRDSSMAPPRSIIPQHPDRAALIKGELERRPEHNSGRSERDDRLIRPSQAQSPRRYEDRRERELNGRSDTRSDTRPDTRLDTRPDVRSDARPDTRPDARLDVRADTRPDNWSDSRPGDWRDERTAMNERKVPADLGNIGRGRGDESNPPTGPRGDRSSRPTAPDHPHHSFDRPRDIFIPNPPAPRPSDPDHGRLNQDSKVSIRQQDLSHGRLNSASEIPSGPRNPGGRGGRTGNTTQIHINTRQAESNQQSSLPSPSLSDSRHPPTGPSFGRGFNRSQPEHPVSAPLSAPPTSTTEPMPNDTTGVHPDRRKGWNRTPDTPSFSRPMPLKTDHAVAAQNAPVQSPASTVPPSGPRGPNPPTTTQAVPSPTSRNPPTGPSSVSERSRGDKRFAQLQNVLQQSGSQMNERNERGASIRGRATRSSGVNGPPPGPSPTNGRPDLFQGQIKGPSNGDDDQSSNRGSRNRESGRDGEPRRSGRHRTSRSHSREHESVRREDDRLLRRDDHRDRDRRGGARDERGSRHSRDEGRDRERRDEGREKERRDGRDGRDQREVRDARDEVDRRDMGESRRWGGMDDRERDSRKDGGSGRKRGRAGDDIMLGRGHSDNKRARRGF